ncbi:hypothetical protein IG631_14173 [Alternaria alternata]|nr:hypothetical protein IG631_14173 [Alternaria alternata]
MPGWMALPLLHCRMADHGLGNASDEDTPRSPQRAGTLTRLRVYYLRNPPLHPCFTNHRRQHRGSGTCSVDRSPTCHFTANAITLARA